MKSATARWISEAFKLQARPASRRNAEGKAVAMGRKLAPARTEIYVNRCMEVANAADSLRHLEEFDLPLDGDMVIGVSLICDSGNTYLETGAGVRLAVDNPTLDQAASEWFGAFRRAVADARARLPFPARQEMQVEWSGKLRLSPQGMVYWTPDENPQFSSIEGLSDATVAVWSIMEE
jgi:hypothetical protein